MHPISERYCGICLGDTMLYYRKSQSYVLIIIHCQNFCPWLCYRLDEAIALLEYVVGMREEKLGTANPDVDDEKRRLAELLKEAGKVRNRKARSLENLLDSNFQHINDNGIKV